MIPMLPEYLRESYSYTDTLGPQSARETFAHVYGKDWNLTIDPERLIPTVGASGGISLACSLFERSGEPLAYITDAPTCGIHRTGQSVSARNDFQCGNGRRGGDTRAHAGAN